MSQPTALLIALADFNDARLDEDELWATEASRREGEQAHHSGVHWNWVSRDTDQEITPDPSREANVGDEAGEAVSLRSREKWPGAVGELPQFALYADEVNSAVGGHIIRHDPARVLADVAWKRLLIANWRALILRIDAEQDAEKRHQLALTRHGLDQAAFLMAAVHDKHPDYQPGFRP